MGFGFEIYWISYDDLNDSPSTTATLFSEDVIAKCNRKKINLSHKKETVFMGRDFRKINSLLIKSGAFCQNRFYAVSVGSVLFVK